MYAAERKTVHEKANHTANDIHDGARRVRDDVRDAADTVKQDLEDLARSAGKQARAFVSSTEDNVAQAAESMTAKIYDNPIQSALIAMGIGLVVGLSLFRGR